ncbi:alternate-type signal peptide domain-containing protein [Nocardioides sp. BP30]|uniref:alternate-type signal peptide domain-containing protein n=1 Tax=Nocardioides sp. BP30 TaxID=3036374 RepID=UPI0024687071|nr:alternate-type signal peptide domain-containing protein [Nocardioides sp. BP30]WGL50406.1 alternate-type signal peptide domain-containing protein [Nocardioides sp. BP30]
MSSRHTPRHRATARRPLLRAVSGAALATVTVVLLVGGQGSLALWKASATLPTASTASGALRLVANPGCGGWRFTQTGGPAAWQGTSYPASTTNANGTQYVEPHDRLTQTCTYRLSATGEHLRATIALTQATISSSAATTAGVAASATYTVNGAAATSVTELDDNASLVATIVLTVPDPVSTLQGTSLTVGGATVSLQQVHA